VFLTAARLGALPGLRHAFFTREGGVSEGPFASLNMGLRNADEPTNVLENRRRAAVELGVTADRLVTARQVHGTSCLQVEAPWPAEAPPKADALVTRQRDLALGVLSADCAPVLLADPWAGVVGAAHAGWRGALDGVLDSVVAGMRELGGRPERILAAIGPCIAQASYEVGSDYRDRFTAADAEAAAFFTIPAASERPRFDLMGYCRQRLLRAGVGQVELLARDTCAEQQLFFSNRRAYLGGDSRFGLQLSAIALA
jgi:polyphenol oxidase